MEASLALQLGLGCIAVFVALIHVCAPRLLRFPTLRPPAERPLLGVDETTPHRYGWVLRGEEKGAIGPTLRFTARSAWTLYVAHQLTHWAIIYAAQIQKPAYSGQLHWLNVLALVTNGAFTLAHLVQTHWSYDGLAQDVPEYSAQMAVLMMLSMIIVMENPRRGLIWGWEAPISVDVTELFRKYHAYFFSWAIVYTLWFHPCDTGLGLLSGFGYLLCILLQGSLFFTSMHLNPYWRVVSEVGLIAHASLVSLEQARAGSGWNIFRMFALGTLGLFVLTYQHGLGLEAGAKLGVVGAYVILVGIGFRSCPQKVPSILAIPVGVLGLYLGCAVGVGWVAILVAGPTGAPVAVTLGMMGFSIVHGFISDNNSQRAAKKACEAAGKAKAA